MEDHYDHRLVVFVQGIAKQLEISLQKENLKLKWVRYYLIYRVKFIDI